MDLTKLTIEQLKVLAYDILLSIERNQNNLRMLNAEIEKRDKEETKIVEDSVIK